MDFPRETARGRRRPERHAGHTGAWCLASLVALFAVTSLRCEPAESGSRADVPMPWSASVSIWFFSGGTALDATERLKITALAARFRGDARLEFGIHRPTAVRELDPPPGSVPHASSAALGPQRLAAIREAMVAEGIPPDHIQVGEFGGRVFDVDRRTVIFVRTTRPAGDARSRGGDDDVSAE